MATAMGTQPDALAHVDADRAIALTRRWVEVNSYTSNIAGVNQVGAMLQEAFALPSLGCEGVPGVEGFGDHLIRRTKAPGKPIGLVGHHDSVFPPGHFEGWREEAGRAIGPGALDMKGGLAVIHAALSALEAAGMLAHLPIAVVCVAEEEAGSPTSKPHLERIAKDAQCALVFESGRAADAIITRRKGVGAMTVTAHGKAAHAGNNHKDGANAIWALSKFVDAAQQLTAYAHALVESLRAAARRADIAGVTLDVQGGANRRPLERTDASIKLRDEYGACAAAEGLGHGEAALLGGGSDANTVAPLGVPVIDGLGPRGAGFHTTTEYVELATFAPKIRALVRFLACRAA